MRRPRWILTACVVVVALGFGVWSMFFRKSAEECRPVVELLEFSQQQGELISSKSSDATDGVPSVADDAVYQQWADGLAQRAERVSDPELASQAVNLADLATQFVTKLPRLRAESQNRAPNAPAPPVVFEMAVLNDKITEQTAQLSKACPG